MGEGLARSGSRQVIWSSPAIVDLFGNGKKEIVVGTGAMPFSTGKKFLAFTAHGSYHQGLPEQDERGGHLLARRSVTSTATARRTSSTPPTTASCACSTGPVRITASTCLAGSWHTCPISYRANAAIADVNNDGIIDIVVGNELSIVVYDKVGGQLVKKAVYGTYGYQPGAFVASPTVVQVGNQTWIVAATTKPGALNVGKVFVWKLNNTLGKAPWPTFKQSVARLSVAP